MSCASIFDQASWAKPSAYSTDKVPSVICTAFNSDASLLLAGTADGFIMYSMENAMPSNSNTSGTAANSGTANGQHFTLNSVYQSRLGVGGRGVPLQSHANFYAQQQHALAAAATQNSFVVPAQNYSNNAAGGGADNDANSTAAASDISGIYWNAKQEVSPQNANAMREVCRRRLYGGVGRAALCERSSVLLLAGASPETSLTITLWDDGLYDDRMARQHAVACERLAEAEKRKAAGGGATSSNTTAASASSSPSPATAPPSPPHILASVSYDVPIRALRINPYCIVIADTISVTLYDRNLSTSTRYDTVWKSGYSQNNSNTVDCSLVPFRRQTGFEETMAIDVACLGKSKGELRMIEFVVSAYSRSRNVKASDLIHKATERTLPNLHNGHIQTLAVASAGRVAVTVSEGGTAIKVVDLEHKVFLRQLSRGSTKTLVPSLVLSPKGDLCICVSDSGTLHCFATTDTLRLSEPVTRGGGGGGHNDPYAKLGSSASAAGGAVGGSVPSRSSAASSVVGGTAPHHGGLDNSCWDDASSFIHGSAGNRAGAGGFAGATDDAVLVSAGSPHGGNPSLGSGTGGGGGALESSPPGSAGYLGSLYGAVAASSKFLPLKYQNATNYLASYASFASVPLLDEADVEAYSHQYDYSNNGLVVPLTAAYCCAALRPEVGGRYRIVVAVGGLSSQSKARCLHFDLHAKGAQRVATFIFPRDPL